jgi:rhamnulokinase
MSFDELEMNARSAEPFRSLIDPDNGDFYHHGHMPEKVQDFCKRTGQPVPESKPQIVRCIMESLALKYRYVYEGLEEVVGKKIPDLHIVGGGCKNVMISQFTANALGRTITTGPIEATSTGNVLGQLIALGYIKDMEEARKVTRNSFEIRKWEPKDTEKWNKKYKYFVDNIVGRE